MSLHKSDVNRNEDHWTDLKSKRHCSLHDYRFRAHKVRSQTDSATGLNVLVPVSKPYHPAVEYGLYELTHKFQRYEDHVLSDLQRMRKQVIIKMKNWAFSGKSPILVVNFVAKFKHRLDSSKIQDDSTVWYCNDFMSTLSHAGIKERLSLSLNDTNQRVGTNTRYAAVVNHLSQ